MKKHLLPEGGKFYKANLHCHTTISDGTWSPERVKEEYKAHGYSIVAYTDHNLLVPHHDLSDDEFLAMSGYELDVNEPSISQTEWLPRKVCHVCFVALKPELDTQVCWNRKTWGYNWGNSLELAKKQAKFDQNEPDFVRLHNPECISEMMKRGRDAGFFVTYNHPSWSNEDYSDYMNYEGMHAMEIVNYGCVRNGYEEYNARVFDDMLRANKRVYCVATDDNHNVDEDSFGGFTMIKAEKLDYELIAKSLLNGHFYASEGPQIHSLYIEDGVVHVTCSPAVKISMKSGVIYCRSLNADDGTPLTAAQFKLNKNQQYFRITVTDASGKHACSNAYFLSDLKEYL